MKNENAYKIVVKYTSYFTSYSPAYFNLEWISQTKAVNYSRFRLSKNDSVVGKLIYDASHRITMDLYIILAWKRHTREVMTWGGEKGEESMRYLHKWYSLVLIGLKITRFIRPCKRLVPEGLSRQTRTFT